MTWEREEGKRGERERSNPPFTVIAPYYDTLMDDVEYDKWVEYLRHILKDLGLKPKRILDLACGTGTISLKLARCGYSVTGVDLSKSMIEIARKKGEGKGVRFLVGDMRTINLGERFDVVICLFDSLNNLLTEKELQETFQRVYEHLEDRGVFLFDMNTIYCLAYYWDDRSRVRENKGITSIWRTSYDQKLHISRLDISIYVPQGNLYKRLDETHYERAYPIEVIDRLLKRAGFSKRYFFDHLTFRKPKSTTLRWMVVALKGE